MHASLGISLLTVFSMLGIISPVGNIQRTILLFFLLNPYSEVSFLRILLTFLLKFTIRKWFQILSRNPLASPNKHSGNKFGLIDVSKSKNLNNHSTLLIVTRIDRQLLIRFVLLIYL